jgi:diaminopimelate decarboxylase
VTVTRHALADRAFVTARPQGLCIDEVPAAAVAERYGTPVSVLSLGQVRANLQHWRSAIARAWPHGPTEVSPSFKANTSAALWRHLAELGSGCDVFGDHELRAALEAGVPADAISLNGTTKPSALLSSAVGYGVKITLDSLDELRRLTTEARRQDTPVRVRLRLRPWLPDATAESDFSPGLPAHVAIHDYRPGVPADELATCVALVEAEPLLDLVGLHAHVARQSTDLSLWAAFGDWMAGAVAQVAALGSGRRVREVSFGGGYAFAGDPTGQAIRRRGEPSPAPDVYLHAMLGAFADRLDERGIAAQDLAVEIEPGRAVFGDAGVHLATVLHVKHQHTPVERVFIETDTSEAFLADVVWESSRFDIVAADDPLRAPDTIASVTGTSCGFDVLRAPEPTPLPAVGDVLAVLDTGAYQDSTANNFNLMARPPLVLVDHDTCRLVRRRELYEDVVARETDEPAERLP